LSGQIQGFEPRRNTMNFRQNRPFHMGSLVIGLGLLSGFTPEISADHWQGPRCSEASLKGPYGVYRTGTAPYGAVAAQGLYVFDGEGGWQLTLNISRNGELFLDEEFEGGYTVNSDCTGEINEGAARFVIVDSGNGFYLLSLLEGGFAMYEVGTRIHTGQGSPPVGESGKSLWAPDKKAIASRPARRLEP
jgi:hypothetical protein